MFANTQPMPRKSLRFTIALSFLTFLPSAIVVCKLAFGMAAYVPGTAQWANRPIDVHFNIAFIRRIAFEWTKYKSVSAVVKNVQIECNPTYNHVV